MARISKAMQDVLDITMGTGAKSTQPKKTSKKQKVEFGKTYEAPAQVVERHTPYGAPEFVDVGIEKRQKATQKFGAGIDRQIAEGNPVLNKYAKKIEGAKSDMKQNRAFDLKTPMSERYLWKGDLGQPDESRPEGYSGLFRASQLKEAGITKAEREEEMDTAQIPSTAIKRVRYNPETKNLYITFTGKGRKEYLFPNVPKAAVTRFLNAASKGVHYSKSIKPKYRVSKSEALAIKKRDNNQ